MFRSRLARTCLGVVFAGLCVLVPASLGTLVEPAAPEQPTAAIAPSGESGPATPRPDGAATAPGDAAKANEAEAARQLTLRRPKPSLRRALANIRQNARTIAGWTAALASDLFERAEADVQAVAKAPADALAAIRAIDPTMPKAGGGEPGHAPGDVTAYAPVEQAPPESNRILAPLPAIKVDIAGVREAIAAYRDGKLAAGDEAARRIVDPLARTTVAWFALRMLPREAGFDRLTAFLDTHPDWPSADWLRRRAEESLYGEKRDPAQVLAFFGKAPPQTAFGKLALAKAYLTTDKGDAATVLVRDVWRGDDCAGNLEAVVLKQFGDRLTRDDHKARTDRLLYKDMNGAALRAATLAGPDVVALAKARIAVAEEAASDKLLAAVAPPLRAEPSYIFARAQVLRRAGKLADAATLLATAPHDPAALVDPDEWWTERRVLARKLLDAGDAKTALKVVLDAAPLSRENKVEAAFHAGWIALRFLDDPTTASREFARLASVAETPLSQSRAAYWQGRAAEAAGDGEGATQFFQAASRHSSTFYGQIARGRLGRFETSVRRAGGIALGDERVEAVRVIELLDALDERDMGFHLALDAAKTLKDERQIAALAAVAEQARDARATLAIGKAASQRGYALDDVAFPTFGIPAYTPLENSAAREIVYAIARQESAFQAKAVSTAGARGLMQMIVSTAKRTASRANVAFSPERLTSDPAFNAQLGAAHLGDLLKEQNGSLVLTFAAYNAGGKRVKDWIAAYGDPRQAGVDPIDWIERIPFTETRNYVQRVMENVEMYKARFAETSEPARPDTTTPTSSTGGDGRPAPIGPLETSTPVPAPTPAPTRVPAPPADPVRAQDAAAEHPRAEPINARL